MRPAINITSRCNNACRMCPFRQGRTTDETDITWEKFCDIICDIKDAEAVMLFNKGEPFLHPKIYEMIILAGEKFPVIISTNGVNVEPERLPYEKIKTLCVSIPAGNRETYENITGRDNFDIVIKKALEMERLSKNEFYVKMVKQPDNVGQEEELKKIFKNVVVVEDSNCDRGYTECSQPDITPVYTASGKKVVCCRDAEEKYEWSKYYNQAKKRQLDICRQCGIC